MHEHISYKLIFDVQKSKHMQPVLEGGQITSPKEILHCCLSKSLGFGLYQISHVSVECINKS